MDGRPDNRTLTQRWPRLKLPAPAIRVAVVSPFLVAYTALAPVAPYLQPIPTLKRLGFVVRSCTALQVCNALVCTCVQRTSSTGGLSRDLCVYVRVRVCVYLCNL